MSDLFGNHIVGFPTRRLIYTQLSCDQIKIGLFFINNRVQYLPYTDTDKDANRKNKTDVTCNHNLSLMKDMLKNRDYLR